MLVIVSKDQRNFSIRTTINNQFGSFREKQMFSSPSSQSMHCRSIARFQGRLAGRSRIQDPLAPGSPVLSKSLLRADYSSRCRTPEMSFDGVEFGGKRLALKGRRENLRSN